MSKFSLDVLQRHVFPFTEVSDPDVILGAAFGEDVALTRVGGDILASHVDPIVGAIVLWGLCVLYFGLAWISRRRNTLTQQY